MGSVPMFVPMFVPLCLFPRHIENFLSQRSISGKEIIEIGLEQARSFNVKIENATVTRVLKNEFFEVYCSR